MLQLISNWYFGQYNCINGGLKGKKHLHMADFPASHVWFPEGKSLDMVNQCLFSIPNRGLLWFTFGMMHDAKIDC